MEIKGITSSHFIGLLIAAVCGAWLFGVVKLCSLAIDNPETSAGYIIGACFLFTVGALVTGFVQHSFVSDCTDAHGKNIVRMFAFWPVFSENSMIWLRMYSAWYKNGYHASTKTERTLRAEWRIAELEREAGEMDR